MKIKMENVTLKLEGNCATKPEVMQLVTDCGHMTQRTHEGEGR